MSDIGENNSKVFVILSVVAVASILLIVLLSIFISNGITSSDNQDEEIGFSQASGDKSKSADSKDASDNPAASATDSESSAGESDPSVVRFPANWTELSNEEKLALNPLNCPAHANGIIYISDITGECLDVNISAAPVTPDLPADGMEFEFTETELESVLGNTALTEDEKLAYMYDYCAHSYAGNGQDNNYCFYWVSPGDRSDNPNYAGEICDVADYSLQIAVPTALESNSGDGYREFCGSAAARERWRELTTEADNLGIDPWQNGNLQQSLKDQYRAGLTFVQTDVILYFVQWER